MTKKTFDKQFADLPTKGAMKFSLIIDRPIPNEDGSSHQQGIQRIAKGGWVVSGSAEAKGYFYTTDTAGQLLSLNTFPEFDHAGGIQVCGDLLVVGLEDKDKKKKSPSKVVFYDISDPANPSPLEHLTINRPASSDGSDPNTAGAVGLVELANCYLLAVANWDAARLDFYVSDGLDLSAAFTKRSSWTEPPNKPDWIDHNWEGYQNINLFADEDTVWLVGMHGGGLTYNKDWADLYRVEAATSSDPVLVKCAKKHFERSGSGPRFRNGSGIFRGEDKAWMYSVEAHVGDERARCNRWGGLEPNASGEITTIADAWVELYDDKNYEDRSIRINYPKNISNMKDVDFGDKTSSARWQIPEGHKFVLYDDKNYQDRAVQLVGNGKVRGIPDLKNSAYNFNDKTSSGRWE